ncbi:MAG: HAMP domain-containing histidine kinase [Clostridiales bacterium]|nr:HAMP domain-containing histidine kinase [Clostridiales bacterium]
MRTIYFKNFLVTAILVVMSFIILAMSFVILGRAFAVSEKRQSIAVNARETASTAAALSENGNLTGWYLRLVISSVARSTGNHILVADTSGAVVSSSDKEIVSPFIGKHINEAILSEILQKGSFQKLTNLNNLYGDQSYYVVGLPIISNQDELLIGYIFVGSDFSEIMDAWGSSTAVFISMAAVILSIALLMSYYTSKRQAEPLNEMAAAAGRFAHGDFSARVTDAGRDDEIGALTASFNTMAESLEKSEQLRAEFIANVSHELKTPMTTIAGFADGILDGTIPVDMQDKYLQTISSETKRLSRLVRQMLEMSRIQATDGTVLLSESFNLSEVIMRTLLTFEPKITDAGLDVDLSLPEEAICVRGNEDAFTQVVYNLLDNAIKFAEKGSKIGLSLWKQDGKAYVSIKNQGPCISPEELPFIFDRFHKTDKSRSRDRDGVGLGLAIVKTILNNHNEDICVKSADCVTEFVFSAKLKH